MAVDVILNFDYDRDTFVWTESELFNFLSEYYGINDVMLYLKNGDEILIKKYNVVGSCLSEDYFLIYNSNGDTKDIIKVYFEDVKKLKAIL